MGMLCTFCYEFKTALKKNEINFLKKDLLTLTPREFLISLP